MTKSSDTAYFVGTIIRKTYLAVNTGTIQVERVKVNFQLGTATCNIISHRVLKTLKGKKMTKSSAKLNHTLDTRSRH